MTAVCLRLLTKNTFPEFGWSEAQFTNEDTQKQTDPYGEEKIMSKNIN